MDRQLVVTLVFMAVAASICVLLSWRLGVDYEKDYDTFIRLALMFLSYASGPLIFWFVGDFLNTRHLWQMPLWLLLVATVAWLLLVWGVFRLGRRSSLPSR